MAKKTKKRVTKRKATAKSRKPAKKKPAKRATKRKATRRPKPSAAMLKKSGTGGTMGTGCGTC